MYELEQIIALIVSLTLVKFLFITLIFVRDHVLQQ